MRKAVKSSDLEVLPLFCPLAQLSRTPLINFNMTLRLLIYQRVNTSSLLHPLLSGTGWDSPVIRTNFRSRIQISPKSVLLLNPLGPLWARSPYQFSRSWSIRLGKISQPSISPLPLLKLLLAMLPLSSVNIASRQLSRRLSHRFKKVPILKKQQSADMRSLWVHGFLE